MRFLICTMVVAVSSNSLEAQYPVKVGEVHPNFQLPSIMDGAAHELNDFHGKKTVLIHFASW